VGAPQRPPLGGVLGRVLGPERGALETLQRALAQAAGGPLVRSRRRGQRDSARQQDRDLRGLPPHRRQGSAGF
jgi:hypothetical protein